MPKPLTPVGKAIRFYALTLALAVAVRLAIPPVGEATLVLTMLTPAVATLLIMAFIAPEGGWRQSLQRLGLLTPGFKAWPLAIGGPAFVHLAGLGILLATGLTALAVPEVSAPPAQVAVKILSGLVVGTLLAMCEEVGWRGYLLPRLVGLGAVSAMLIVGFLHGVWHMPVMLTTDLYHNTGSPLIVVPLFLLTVTLAGLFFGFLRLWSGSVWPVAIAHGAANMAWEVSGEFSQNKSAMATEYIGGESGLIMIVALLAFGVLIIRFMRNAPDDYRQGGRNDRSD